MTPPAISRGVAGDFGKVGQGSLNSLVGIGSVFELSGEIAIIGSHVEMTVTREREVDGLRLTGALGRERLVDRDPNRMVAFGRGNDPLGAGEGNALLEGRALRDGDGFDQ